MEEKLKYNAEHYPDPTPYNAIKKIESEHERHRKLIGCILRICELAGFEVMDRIVLLDKTTGKIWR